MINNDLIQVVFTPEEKENAKQALRTLQDIATSKAPVLSNDDRQNYGSVAEQNKLKINKARIYMQQFPELIPSFIDKDEFERDFQARNDVEELLMLNEDIHRKLSDMKILLDYDNYQDVLAFYRSVRYSASEKVGNAVTVYNDMKQFFPRTVSTKTEAQAK
jgi:methyl coenzyme M reductase subunit C-like uncharacterized protein (methanogenesis marker protein 7)